MKPMRIAVRVHATLVCLAILVGIALFALSVVERNELFFSILLFSAFGEVALLIERFYLFLGFSKDTKASIQ